MIRIKYRWIHELPNESGTVSANEEFRSEYDGVWMGSVRERTMSIPDLIQFIDGTDIRITEMEMVSE